MLDNKEFEDKAWGLMLERLDKEKPEKKMVAWWKYAGLFLLLLLGSAAAYSSFVYVGESKEIVNVSQITAQTTMDTRDDAHLTDHNDVSLSNFGDVSEYNALEENRDKVGSSKELINASNQSGSFPISEKVYVSDSYKEGQSDIKRSFVSLASSDQKVNSTIIFESNEAKTPNEEPAAVITEVVRTFPKADKFKSKISSALDKHATSNLEPILKLQINERNFGPIISTLEKPISERIVQSYFAVETSYLSDFDQLALRLSLLTEAGSTQSPWSMTTGLSYQRVKFSSFSLFGNSDREFAVATVGDTTNEETIPTNVGDSNAEKRSIGSLLTVDYVGIPLLFSYRMNRLQVGLGIENNFAIYKRFDSGNEFFSNEVYEDRVFDYQLNLAQEINFNVTSQFQVGLRARFDLTGAHGYSSDYLRNLDQFGFQLKYRIL